MRRARTASGGSEEVARDTSRPRTDDLEDGVPLPLLKHGIEVLRALATAAASTAERRVARKDINSKPPHGSWQALFDASKPSSLVARGYAAKGYGAGPDYGRYWITAAGLEYLAAEWLKLNVPEERFTKMFVRSDNAASHFKSKYTLRFLSFFKSLYGLAHVVWDFGCPGHGKGPWDGIAGMLKSWLRRTALTHSMDKVDRGPKDCADRLRAHFETNAWRAAHDAPKYKIKRVVVDWTGEGDIKRPSHWECGAGGTVVHAVRSTEVAPLRGVSENYSYCMLRPGFVGVRRHTCWCKACLGCDGRALEGGTATAPTARVDVCAAGDAPRPPRAHGRRRARTRTMRFNDGESIARDLKDNEGTSTRDDLQQNARG
ncbi:hypothetical protein JL721_8088 [Aureococcus anophagefferens]|nr:hypothetical protein JL721_8088 [Aureococcus anophagefferens]